MILHVLFYYVHSQFAVIHTLDKCVQWLASHLKNKRLVKTKLFHWWESKWSQIEKVQENKKHVVIYGNISLSKIYEIHVYWRRISVELLTYNSSNFFNIVDEKVFRKSISKLFEKELKSLVLKKFSLQNKNGTWKNL